MVYFGSINSTSYFNVLVWKAREEINRKKRVDVVSYLSHKKKLISRGCAAILINNAAKWINNNIKLVSLKQLVANVNLHCFQWFFCFVSEEEMLFCIYNISKTNQNLAKKKTKTGQCLIHLRKPAGKISSCFGNVQFYPKILYAIFPPNS